MWQARKYQILSCLLLLNLTFSFHDGSSGLTQYIKPFLSQNRNHLSCAYDKKAQLRKSSHLMAITTPNDKAVLKQDDIVFGAGLLSFGVYLLIQHDTFLLLLSGGMESTAIYLRLLNFDVSNCFYRFVNFGKCGQW